MPCRTRGNNRNVNTAGRKTRLAGEHILRQGMLMATSMEGNKASVHANKTMITEMPSITISGSSSERRTDQSSCCTQISSLRTPTANTTLPCLVRSIDRFGVVIHFIQRAD
mmetsp:Transcript_11421/g.32774  ORF Transcript_11421/g.32774 Transcript_11421/m.32774 type:complete len:111 (-) Transcript_11421:250-582(-)